MELTRAETRAFTPTPAGASGPSEEARAIFLAAAWIHPPVAVLERLEEARDRRSLWLQAAALAERSHQEPLFWRLIDLWAPFAPLDARERAELEGQGRFHAFRWAGLRAAAERALSTLGKIGARPVLLKGIAQAGERYDPPALRPMRDVDLLVRPDVAKAAFEALLAAGFVEGRGAPIQYEGHHHLAPLFDPETDTCIELHHRVLGLPKSFRGFPPTSELLAAVRESKVFPGAASVLEPTFDLLCTAAHSTHGDSIGRRTHNLVDAARIIELDGASIDWERLLRWGRCPHVARALSVPLGYLEREGLPTAPAATLARLRECARLPERERRLLYALTDRYRIGAPAGWRLVSGRLSNILWRQALRRGPALVRAASALWQALWSRHA